MRIDVEVRSRRERHRRVRAATYDIRTAAERARALRLLREQPGLRDNLTENDHAIMVAAADRGATDAIRLNVTGNPPLMRRYGVQTFGQ
jgi:hypothetical protein